MSLDTKMPERTRGANRSTKAAGKLKVLPEQLDQPPLTAGPRTAQLIDDSDLADVSEAPKQIETSEEDESEELQDQEDVEVYNQISQIPEGTARKDALRLTKKTAKSLPRVTAYCTASSYRMDDLLKFFHARKSAYRTAVRRFDEVIYTPYSYDLKTQQRTGPGADPNPEANTTTDRDFLVSITPETDHSPPVSPNESARRPDTKPKIKRFQTEQTEGEADVFLFEYGVRISSLEKLNAELKWAYVNIGASIDGCYVGNDRSSGKKIPYINFEELISNTIEQTKDIPGIISKTGKIRMRHKEIMRQIGQLFMLRININLVGSVLDAPSFPDLQPLYDAARSYLEIPQRTRVLNARVEVLQDMLQLLKESAGRFKIQLFEFLLSTDLNLPYVRYSDRHYNYIGRPLLWKLTLLLYSQ
ncbi:hypothetical protein Clacol_004752 [Clathrus columnatus]|uniref:DUF155 domain-containing protein n=1 Tax=Clathrus columnatus TaxID=1419009 RepID=A0AAV5ABX8_9AGAM|nr:hypothetical protein Clacol_004752 [Clathrus columnatus]